MTIVSDHGRNCDADHNCRGEFKAKCLKLLDQVASERQTLVTAESNPSLRQARRWRSTKDAVWDKRRETR